MENLHGKHEKDDRKRGKLSCGLFSEPQTDQPIMLPLGGPQTRHPYESYHPAASPPSTVIQSSEALSGTNLNHATLPPLVQSEEADLADPPSRRHRSRNPLKRLFSKSMSKLKHRSASQPPSPERMLSSSEAGGSHKLFQRSRSASQPPSPERGAFPPPHRGWFSKSSKKGKSLPTTPTGKGPGELGAHVRRPSGYYYQVDVAPSLSPVPSWLPPQDSQSRSSAPSAGPVEDLPTTPRGADYGARGPPWSAPTTPQSHEVIQWSGPSTPTVTETPPSSGPSSPLPTMASQWYSPGKSAGAVTLNQSAESLTPNQSAESLTQSYENLPRSGPESPTRESAQTIPPVPHNSPSQQSSWQTYGDRTVVTSSPMSGVSVQGGTSPSLEDPLVFEVPVLGLPQEKRAELGMKPPHFSEVQEFGKDEAPSPISVMDRSGYESPGVQDGVAVSHPLAEISEEPGSDTPSEYEDASDGLRTAGSGFADETAGEAGVKDSPVESGEEGVDTGSCAGVPPGAEQSVNTALGAEHEAGAALEQKEPEESGAREVEFVEVSETQNVSGFEPSEMEERDGSEAWKEEPIAVSQPQSEKGLTPSEVEERGGSGVRKEGSAASSELQTETGKSEFEERSEGGIRKEGAAEVVEPHDETGPEAQTFEERPESGLGKAAVAESPEPRHEMGSRPLDFEELGRQAVRKGGVVASLEPLVEKETRASDLEEHPESRLSKEETVESSLPQSGTVFSALAKRNGSAGEKASSGAVSELLNKIVRSGHEEVGSAGFGSVARVPVPANGEELGAEESGTGGAGVPVAGETESVPEKTILPEQGLAEEPSEDSAFRPPSDGTDNDFGATENTEGTGGDEPHNPRRLTSVNPSHDPESRQQLATAERAKGAEAGLEPVEEGGEDEQRKPGRVSAGIRELVSFFETEASKLLGMHPAGQNSSPEKSKRPETEAGDKTGPVGAAAESAVPSETGKEQKGSLAEEVASQQPASLERESGLSTVAPPETGRVGTEAESAVPSEIGREQTGGPVEEATPVPPASLERESGPSAAAPPFETGSLIAEPESAVPLETGTEENGSPVEKATSSPPASLERESGPSAAAPPFETGPLIAEPESAVPLETGTEENGSAVEKATSLPPASLKRESETSVAEPPFETGPVGAKPESAVPLEIGTEQNESPVGEAKSQQAASLEREGGLSAVAPPKTGPVIAEPESAVPLETGTEQDGRAVEGVPLQQAKTLLEEWGHSADAPPFEMGPVAAEPESTVPSETGTDHNGSSVMKEGSSQQPVSLERESGPSAVVHRNETGPAAPESAVPSETGTGQDGMADEGVPLQQAKALLEEWGRSADAPLFEMGPVAAEPGVAVPSETGTDQNGTPVEEGASQQPGSLERESGSSAVAPLFETRPVAAELGSAVHPETGTEQNGSSVEEVASQQPGSLERESGPLADAPPFDVRRDGATAAASGGLGAQATEPAEPAESLRSVDLNFGCLLGAYRAHKTYRDLVAPPVADQDAANKSGQPEPETLPAESFASPGGGTWPEWTRSVGNSGTKERNGSVVGGERGVGESWGGGAKPDAGAADYGEFGGSGTAMTKGTAEAEEDGIADESGTAERSDVPEKRRAVGGRGRAEESGTAKADRVVIEGGTAEASGFREENGTVNETAFAEVSELAEENGTAKENGVAEESGNAKPSDLPEEGEIAGDERIVEVGGTAGLGGSLGKKGTADVEGTVGLDGTSADDGIGVEDQTTEDTGSEDGIEAGQTGIGDGNKRSKEKSAEEETGASAESGDGKPSGKVAGNGFTKDALLDPSPEAPMGAGVAAPRSSHVEDRKGRHVDSQEGQIEEIEEDVESTGATGGAAKADVTDDASSRRRRAVRWRDDVSAGAQEDVKRAPDSDPGPARGRNAIQAWPAKPPPHPVIQLLLVGGILGKAAVKTSVGMTYITLQQCGVLAKATTNLVLEDAKGVVGTLAKQAGRVIGLEKRTRLFA